LNFQFDLDKEEVFLVGNKIDLDFREVSHEEGKSVSHVHITRFFL